MIWSGDARRMHAAADGDDSDNDGGDMELMVMVEGEMKRQKRLPVCLPTDLDDAASLGLPPGGRRVLSLGAKRAGRYY